MGTHKNYNLHANEYFVMQCYEIDVKILEPIRLIRLKLYHDGFKPTQSLEWWSAVASVMFLASKVITCFIHSSNSGMKS